MFFVGYEAACATLTKGTANGGIASILFREACGPWQLSLIWSYGPDGPCRLLIQLKPLPRRGFPLLPDGRRWRLPQLRSVTRSRDPLRMLQ